MKAGKPVVSMTGFGRGEATAGGVRARIEVRSINSRGREVHVRSAHPDLPLSVEEEIRSLAEGAARRGRLDLRVDVSSDSMRVERAFHEPTAAAYVKQLAALAKKLGLSDRPSLDLVLRLPGVVAPSRPASDPDAVLPAVRLAAGKAFTSLSAARQREGKRLAADLGNRLLTIAGVVRDVHALLPEASAALRERLRKRLADALAGAGVVVEEPRMLAEAALAAQKADVEEEVVRLESHLAEAKTTLARGGEVGRRLDFLAQEMLRETQTLASKAGDLRLTRAAMQIKEELERIREQVQNLE